MFLRIHQYISSSAGKSVVMPPTVSTEEYHTGTGLSKNVTKLKIGVQRDHGQVIHALDDLKRNPGSQDMKN